MSETKTYVFPENGEGGGYRGIDPALLVALNQNGGMANGAMWMWPMFMFMMYPWLFGGMGNGFGGFGGWGNAGAANALASWLTSSTQMWAMCRMASMLFRWPFSR